MQFAYASTCQLALDGVSNGGIADITEAIGTAHAHAAMFEPASSPTT